LKSYLWLFPLLGIGFILSCDRKNGDGSVPHDNPEIPLEIPDGFPPLNPAAAKNQPTKYGVELGKRLFHETKLSRNSTVSCASCHKPAHAFADNNPRAVGIDGRIGLRNTPPLQNLAFMRFYNWDGSKLSLERQAIVPIITHEEMNSSIGEAIGKIGEDATYRNLFRKAFGDDGITADRIYRSLAQYQYTLVSADSKYDRVRRNEGETFTESEARGHEVFKLKCASCHATELFTDQSFRNVGFPQNPSAEEAGRARVTGLPDDRMRFRVPSLRNAERTAPYGSFGQFPTLRSVLDHFDNGVPDAANLDPILKDNGGRIPLSEQEKDEIIDFIRTLNDEGFVR